MSCTTSRTRRHSWFAALVFLAPLSPLFAQWVEPDAQSVLAVTGKQNGDLFGWLVLAPGDLNGDGVPDFAATAPFFDVGGKSSAGRVAAFSGRDGAELWGQTGTRTSDILGFSLTSIGDVDGDGARELVSGAPFNGGAGDNAFVYSGRTGAILHTFAAEAAQDSYGHSVAGGGDFDGDGIEDLAIAGTDVDSSAADAGRVYVYSTQGFGLITTIDPPVSETQFGAGLAFLGDIDHDGRDELVIGARVSLDSAKGRAHVFSWKSGAPALDYSFDGIGMGGALDGDRVDAGRDVNGDGVPDIFAGDLFTASAQVHSGVDGALLYKLTGQNKDTFGSGGLIADVDQDGAADLLIGARLNDSGGADAGKVSLYSGRTGALLRTMTSSVAGTVFGADAAVIGDLNGAGAPETVVGASGSATGGKGKVFVMAGSPCRAAWANYGAGHPGTLGIPGFTASGNPVLGSTISLDAQNSLGTSTTGVLLAGATQASISGSWGGTLLVLPQLIVPVTLPASGLSVPAAIPLDSTLCGLSLFTQVLELDAGASHGISATPGLSLLLGE